MICSDLEVGDKIELNPYPFTQFTQYRKSLTISGITIYENFGEYDWRRIFFVELPNYWLHLSVFDNYEIDKYGIKIIKLIEE